MKGKAGSLSGIMQPENTNLEARTPTECSNPEKPEKGRSMHEQDTKTNMQKRYRSEDQKCHNLRPK